MKKDLPTTAAAPTAIRGLDYTPQRPAIEGLSYGVAPRVKAGRRQSAHEIVDRRLSNFDAATGEPLCRPPTCRNHDILLPDNAPDSCGTYRGLCDHFEGQSLAHQKDLIGVLTLRFQNSDLRHWMWELSRAFLYRRVAIARELPVVLALHVPSIAARSSPPHVHALIFLRQLPGSDWGVFDNDLCGPTAKSMLAKEWIDWLRNTGDVS